MIPPIPAIQSGLLTVRRGLNRLDAAAETLSTAYLPVEDGQPSGGNDVVGALVEMMLAKHQVSLGAKVIERASQAEKDLLNIVV